jgi:RNA polymerase sigma factor (TIGR02999 family)
VQPEETGEDLTRLLESASGGDRDAFDRVVTRVYAELRAIARRQLRGERPGHTLHTTALVNEAFLKLAKLDRIRWQNREHFFAIAARSMRNVLVSYAVRRRRLKRGGGVPDVPLDEASLLPDERVDQVLALHEALQDLEKVDERHARIVECRFFAGMTIEETATALGISPATVKRDWQLLRAWLQRELAG